MHSVPQTTLEQYISKYWVNPDNSVFFEKKLGHFKTVFSFEREEETDGSRTSREDIS